MTESTIKTPFDIVSNINEKHGFLEDVESLGGLLDPFVINRAFSNTQDSVLFANEMNMAWSLPKGMQYGFYYHGLPKNKYRFGKWNKNTDDKEEISVIMEYFGYSRQKAKQVQSLLRPHMDAMKKELEKGGRSGRDNTTVKRSKSKA